MSPLWFVSLNSISPSPDPSISVSLCLSPPTPLPHTHTLALPSSPCLTSRLFATHFYFHHASLSLSPPLSRWVSERVDERVIVGEWAYPLMHSWSLIKVLYTVRKCIWAPVAGAPLRHTGNGCLADSQSCYFRGSSGANQAGPGQLMDQWLFFSLHPKNLQQLDNVGA